MSGLARPVARAGSPRPRPAQRVEHYEIAGYGTVRTFANMLGLSDQADLLQQTLDEEGQTDKRLTSLAETVVNIDAVKE